MLLVFINLKTIKVKYQHRFTVGEKWNLFVVFPGDLSGLYFLVFHEGFFVFFLYDMR